MKRMKLLIQKIKRHERGAVVAEATIALTAFVFAIYLIISVIDICYVQAKMGIALNSAAKEMSQYAYLYDTMGLDVFNGEGGKSSALMDSFSEVISKISNGASNFSQDLGQLLNTASEKAGGDSASEYIKNGIGMGFAKLCVQKNLKDYDGDDPDAFLRRWHVKDGLSGLNFINTTFLTDVNQSEISLIVAYQVQVVRLLDTEYTFNFVQRAQTKGWGKGVSLSKGSQVTPIGVWDAGNISRGNSIITSEKKAYSYTSASYNFHAYDKSKNQFVRIRSIDTFSDSYAGDPSAIESQIKQSYTTMQSSVSKLDEDISMVNKSGSDEIVKSDPSTRTYKIVLVVPDSADMETVNTAITNFTSKNPGVEVEVKTGYGDPASAKSPPATEETPTQEAA